MITLSRRGFLQLTFSAIAAAAATPLEQFVVTTSVPRRLWLYDIYAESQTEGAGFFNLARPNGAPLLQMPLSPGWFLRWVCVPGNEIVIPIGEGLLNLSTCPVRLRLHVTDNEDRWVVDETGRAIGLNTHTPALYTRLWVPQADGRYKLEAA